MEKEDLCDEENEENEDSYDDESESEEIEDMDKKDIDDEIFTNTELTIECEEIFLSVWDS